MILRRIILLVLFCGGSAFAQQSPANFPWWNSPLRADLNLTNDQSEKIHQIVKSYRARLLDSRNNVSKAEGDLDDLLNDGQIDLAAAKPLIDKLAGAKANSTRVFLQMSLEVRAVLTLDQWRILVRKRAEQRRDARPSEIQVAP